MLVKLAQVLQVDNFSSVMSIGTDEIVVALYDYTAKDAEELSIKKYEQLTLLDPKFSWWKVRNNSGKIGLVPSNYLRRDKNKGESLVNRIANKLPGGKNKRPTATTGGSTVPTGGVIGKVMPPPFNAAPAPSTQLNEEYVSKFDYGAKKDDELTLTKGMKVLVLKTEEDGWWYGKDADSNGIPGWFPSNYVVKSSEIPNSPVPQHIKPQANGCLMVVRCLYPFTTRNQEELGFAQDELLDIIEEPLDDPEWWLARNSEGVKGLVPKNYVEEEPGAQAVSPPDDVAPPKKDPFIPNNDNSSSNANGVDNKDWFFGPLRRSEAEQLLEKHAQNGEFLVRNSETAAGEYSISMKMPERMRHFKINVLESGAYGIGQKRFDTIDDLLEHYKRAPIYTNKEQGKFYLTNPVAR